MSLFEISEFNPTPDLINMSAANDWHLKGLNDLPCNSGSIPYGIEVFRGYYSLQNLSSASNVLGFAQSGLDCIGTESPNSFPVEPASLYPAVLWMAPTPSMERR